MATNYGNHFSTLQTKQTEKASENQKKNNAGGYSFVISPWDQLDRFLILGSEGGTYYTSEKQLTIENCKSIQKLIAEDGVRVVNRVVEISEQGRAPKNDPAIFILAMCAGSSEQAVRAASYAALPKVCRIGTHLFHFARDVKQFRGWSRGLRRAVANWYTQKTPLSLANQVIKYQQRDGWSNRDLLRLSHPKAKSAEQNAIFQWVVAQADDKKAEKRAKINDADLPVIIKAAEEVQSTDNVKRVVELIREFKLPREIVPTEHLSNVQVWEALLENMGTTALIRNLGKMTSIDLLAPLSSATKKVCDQITNEAILKKDRIHPMTVLIALKQYSAGHGLLGQLIWSPSAQIIDALNSSFYTSFGNVEPTNKNLVLALDVSGSMMSAISKTNLSCREASAAMALITASVEQNYVIVGFSHSLMELKISSKQRLDDVVNYISGLSFGRTDCSLPMIWAQQNKLKVDAFSVYTDNETWCGKIHPHQALNQYRKSSGLPAKSVVVGMTATNFTIADPNDSGMLDVVGFDSAVPQIISDFVRS